MDDPNRPERHINIHFSPDIMAGVYANFANVSHSDYEFTITFARVDHEVEDERDPRRGRLPDQPQRQVHARADRRDAGQLLQVADPRGDQEPARVRRLPTTRGRALDEPGAAALRPNASRPRPIRSAVGGCVASSDVTQRGGSRSATFWSAIARSNETNASGAPVSSSENASARRSIARDRRLPISPIGARRPAGGERQRGQRAGGAALGRQPQLSRWTASAAAGATSAAYSTPRGHVAVAHVGELVGDDDADLVAAVAVEQRVEQHHPLGRPEPGHVGVGGGRPAAGVDRVHLPHLDAGGRARARARRRASRPRAAA